MRRNIGLVSSLSIAMVMALASGGAIAGDDVTSPRALSKFSASSATQDSVLDGGSVPTTAKTTLTGIGTIADPDEGDDTSYTYYLYSAGTIGGACGLRAQLKVKTTDGDDEPGVALTLVGRVTSGSSTKSTSFSISKYGSATVMPATSDYTVDFEQSDNPDIEIPAGVSSFDAMSTCL